MSQSTNVILVLSGALNPCHRAHLELLYAAKEELETKYRCQVKLSFLAPSSDHYVKDKLRGWAMKLNHRIQLCQNLISDITSTFSNQANMEIFTKGWASGDFIARSLYGMYKDKYENLVVYEVYGGDYILKTQAWDFKASQRNRYIIGVGRQETTKLITQGMKQSRNINPNFIFVNRELTDVSSTKIRQALETNDAAQLKELIDKNYITRQSLKYIQDNRNNLFIPAK